MKDEQTIWKQALCIEPAKVKHMNNEEAVQKSLRLGKPIIGPMDLKKNLHGDDRLCSMFFIPISEDGEYTLLAVVDENLQAFCDLAKKYEVEMIPAPNYRMVLGEEIPDER